MATQSSSPKRRRMLDILGAGVIIVGLGVLVFLLFGPNLGPSAIDLEKAQVFPRIEKAIQATFPTYCNTGNDQLKIDPELIPPDQVITLWAVRCLPERAPWPGPLVDINIDICTIQRPISGSEDWYTANSWAIDKEGHLPKLVGCP